MGGDSACRTSSRSLKCCMCVEYHLSRASLYGVNSTTPSFFASRNLPCG